MSKSLIIAALFALFLHGAAALGAEPQPDKPNDEELLTLPWKQFDQTLGSGWRVYACRNEHGAAAALIEEYLARRTDLTTTQRAVSHFHAAAELARDNRYQEALRHLDRAEVTPGSRGVPEDWNELVIATRAFLLGETARRCLQPNNASRQCALRRFRVRPLATSSISASATERGTKSLVPPRAANPQSKRPDFGRLATRGAPAHAAT